MNGWGHSVKVPEGDSLENLLISVRLEIHDSAQNQLMRALKTWNSGISTDDEFMDELKLIRHTADELNRNLRHIFDAVKEFKQQGGVR